MAYYYNWCHNYFFKTTIYNLFVHGIIGIIMRHISKSLIVLTVFVSLLIFCSGLAIGMFIDQTTISSVNENLTSISDRTNSNFAIFLLEKSPLYCPLYQEELASLESEVERVGYKISYLETEKNIIDPALKRRYMNLQLNSYLLSENVKRLCYENYTTILYFYSDNTKYLECREQGANLLELKKDDSFWVKIYSFDADIDSASTQILAKQFNVTQYPALVINGQTYQGMLNKEQLKNIISNST